jgi:hypothetical protein
MKRNKKTARYCPIENKIVRTNYCFRIDCPYLSHTSFSCSWARVFNRRYHRRPVGKSLASGARPFRRGRGGRITPSQFLLPQYDHSVPVPAYGPQGGTDDKPANQNPVSVSGPIQESMDDSCQNHTPPDHVFERVQAAYDEGYMTADSLMSLYDYQTTDDMPIEPDESLTCFDSENLEILREEGSDVILTDPRDSERGAYEFGLNESENPAPGVNQDNDFSKQGLADCQLTVHHDLPLSGLPGLSDPGQINFTSMEVGGSGSDFY